MIYLRNTTESQVVFVPKNGPVPVGDLVFKAVSTIDLDEKVNQAVTDLQTSEMYFNIAVSLPGDVPDGEYAYSICMGDSVLSSGLLVIGENTYPSEYDKDITYEQYSSE